MVGDGSVRGALGDEIGDGLLWDGGEAPRVDADVDLTVLLAPFLVDMAVKQPVAFVLGSPLGELHVVAVVKLVGKVAEARLLPGDGVGLGIVNDLVYAADAVIVAPLPAVVSAALLPASNPER